MHFLCSRFFSFPILLSPTSLSLHSLNSVSYDSFVDSEHPIGCLYKNPNSSAFQLLQGTSYTNCTPISRRPSRRAFTLALNALPCISWIWDRRTFGIEKSFRSRPWNPTSPYLAGACFSLPQAPRFQTQQHAISLIFFSCLVRHPYDQFWFNARCSTLSNSIASYLLYLSRLHSFWLGSPRKRSFCLARRSQEMKLILRLDGKIWLIWGLTALKTSLTIGNFVLHFLGRQRRSHVWWGYSRKAVEQCSFMARKERKTCSPCDLNYKLQLAVKATSTIDI